MAVDLMRSGKKEAAVKYFIEREKAFVPQKLLKREVGHTLLQAIQDGILEELDDIHCGDPGRSFHIFLMLNDQRRHLANHFENTDLHRLEFQLPFYDSEFVRSIVAVPIDLCLRHLFYVKLLQYLPPIVTKIPWKSYPGHEPCPLTVSEELRSQLQQPIHGNSGSRKQRILEKAFRILRAADFAGEILDRHCLQLAVLIHRTGFRDYTHVIEAASTYQKYWSLSGGKYVLDSKESCSGRC
jgi:hypothetical protein